MNLFKGFLCVSTAALAFCACGRSDARFLSDRLAQYAASSGDNSPWSSESSAFAGKFSPKVHEDAEIALGLNLDLKKLAKIGDGFIDQAIAMVKETKTKKRLVAPLTEIKETYKDFVDDPFSKTPPKFREFVKEVGLRNAKVGWAVVSVENISFENGTTPSDLVKGTAVAIATDVNIEKIVAYAKREADKAGFSIGEGTLAGKKAWNFLPKDEDVKHQFREKQLYPCFTSLDGQLVLIASSPAMLTKQIRLYREGKGEGSLLREFKPANGDLARLAVKDLGAILRKLPADKRKKIDLPQLQNGNELVLRLKDLNFALTSQSSSQVALSLKLRTALAEDADSLRNLLQMLVSMAQNPDTGMPKPFTDAIKHIKITGTGTVVEGEIDNIIPIVNVIAIPNFIRFSDEK